MGNCCCKQSHQDEFNEPAVPLPVTGGAHHGQHHAPTGPSQARPNRTTAMMDKQIRNEFLTALNRAFGSLDYAVIGGTALAEYGSVRATSDIDVMIPSNISEVVESQLLENGIVRTDGRGLGFVASDGNCYGLDLTTDTRIGRTFEGWQNTTISQPSGAHLLPIEYLLDSKAFSYMTRTGTDASQKKLNDARDIFFIIDYLRRKNIKLNPQHSKWVVDYDFWTTFTQAFDGAEQDFVNLGLQREPTPNNSNRSIRTSTSASRASRDSRGSQ